MKISPSSHTATAKTDSCIMQITCGGHPHLAGPPTPTHMPPAASHVTSTTPKWTSHKPLSMPPRAAPAQLSCCARLTNATSSTSTAMYQKRPFLPIACMAVLVGSSALACLGLSLWTTWRSASSPFTPQVNFNLPWKICSLFFLFLIALMNVGI